VCDSICGVCVCVCVVCDKVCGVCVRVCVWSARGKYECECDCVVCV